MSLARHVTDSRPIASSVFERGLLFKCHIILNVRRYRWEDPAYVQIPILTIDDSYTLTLTPAVI